MGFKLIEYNFAPSFDYAASGVTINGVAVYGYSAVGELGVLIYNRHVNTVSLYKLDNRGV
ncbi:hypothetical protein N473_01190 [Pseudoalteromonas luteoviolacea CPMOR-1]|uniref:Uncharacterized protein n=1 Tax=Pseudoalteromonas luteoviolacea CPMOR-1 TaxID=1365248 RepID=A0A167LU58_9GAMM|nr:hypothetical protein N473_01190 [Pseudoalteromonas luteoviolacea CPMOR-1]